MQQVVRSAIIFGLFVLFSGSLHAQVKTDSLKQLAEGDDWDIISSHDQVEILNHLIEANLFQAPVEAIRYVNMALTLARNLGDTIAEADLLKYMGTAYFNQSKYQQALLHYINSRKKATEIHYLKGEASACYNLGLVFSAIGRYEKAIGYFTESLVIDRQTNNSRGEASCLNGIGIAYEKRHDYKKALVYYQKSLGVCQKVNDAECIVNSLHNIGNIYKSLGDFEEALEYYQQALVLARKSNIFSREIRTLYSIGEVYERLSQLDKSLGYYLKVVEGSRLIDDRKAIAMATNNIGNIYKARKKFSKALENYEESLAMMKMLNDQTGVAIALDNMGNILVNLQEYNKALGYYHKALNIKEQMLNKSGKAASMNNIGELYYQRADFEQALSYFLQAHTHHKELDTKTGLAYAAKNVGKTYYRMKSYGKASKFFGQCIDLATETKMKSLEKNAYGLLAEMFAETNRYNEAYYYQKLYSALKDSILNEVSVRRLVELETFYDTEKKTYQNELLKKENELSGQTILKQKIIAVSISIGLVIMAMSALFLFRSRQREKKSNQLLRSQKEEISAQAEQLKLQKDQLVEMDQFKEAMTGMIVHDLKNPLNTIINVSNNEPLVSLKRVKQSGKQMLNMVLNILDVYKYEENRFIVDKVDCLLNSIVENALRDVDFLLEQKNITIYNTVEAGLGVKGDKEILERVIVNLLSNAIKYSPINGSISINYIEDEITNNVRISVTDTGEGIPADKLSTIFDKFVQVQAKASGKIRSTGLGLTFCKKAVEAHGGEIGVSSKLEDGTTFWFTLEMTQVDSMKPTEQISNWENKCAIVLSETDKKLVKPIAKSLQKLLVYETTEIEELLKQVNTENNNALEIWMQEIKGCLHSLNEGKYKELVGLIDS